MDYKAPVILSIYPNSVGIGYACLQLPDRLLDFGVTTTKPISNGKLLRRIERFMDYYRPEIILLKETGASHNGGRTDKLIEAVTTLAGENGMAVYRYAKDRIDDVFEILGAKTKFEMVEKITRIFPDLSMRMPKPRKWYEKEDYNMVLFNAVSLAVTHAYLAE